MKTSDFYYDLPKELIAQDPLEDRSASRLMHLNKETGEYEHGHFRDILKYLKPGDCLVINDTKVIPARLYGSKVGTDAAIEILLLKRRENDIWETLVKPGKKCKVGTVISFGDGILTGEVVDIGDEGNRLIQFHYEGIFEEILDQLGEMTLTPYITQVAAGKREKLGVFGNDYDTPDGTGVRDYIHVVDLAKGHVKALRKLEDNSGLSIYNLGTGKGYSVLDIVKNFEAATGVKIPYVIKARRPGDIATCYSDASKAERELGWKAENGIREMCADSWRWQSNNPNGYEE